MSKELSIFEQMGGTYTEVDGILYPNLKMESGIEADQQIGKYGQIWLSYMKENNRGRFISLLLSGKLYEKAVEVNEEAYGLLDTIMEQYLKKNPPINPSSTMEMWKLREQAKQVAEEVIYHDIIYKLQ